MKTDILDSLNNLCYEMGKDPFLVQGAGGNVSWKDSNVMWVKASGTCLSEAKEKNIFVPVDLISLQNAMNTGNFSYVPKAIENYSLRPSIETLLHGLMKQKVVVHLHLVSSLIHLIKKDAKKILTKLIGSELNWGFVKYCKPGAKLAEEMSKLLDSDKTLDVIFLANHGIVIGSETVQKANEIVKLLDKIFGRESIKRKVVPKSEKIFTKISDIDFDWISNDQLNLLAQEDFYLRFIKKSWAIFPDHVVFLGHRPVIVDDIPSIEDIEAKKLRNTPFIFVKKVGVLQNNESTNAQLEQLLCYFNVISNIDSQSNINNISDREVAQLLNWDAEVYRQEMSK